MRHKGREQKEFHHISLKQIVYSVTCYSITTADCIGWKNRKILRTVRLDKYSSPKIIPIIDADTLVKKAIASRMTKNLYKDNIGGTIKEWRECKDLFQLVCSPTLYEDIAGMLHCSIQQAKENVDLFISRINSNFDLGDIDSDVLARIAMNHDGLRTQCEAAVEEHWKTTHAEALAEAQIELDQKKQAAENIVNEYKSQFEKIKADKKNAEEAYQKILTETAEAQAKLDQLLKEIEKYETLGANAVQAIRDKIGSAQQDMAGFIAELSTFMPQQCVQSGSTNRWTFTPGEVCHRMDNLEGCSSWRDTFELLCDNLQLAGIGSQWTTMLSSFLYSSYLNRMPLLLAGPNAKAIADALSMTICGQKIDLLTCCGEQDAEAQHDLADVLLFRAADKDIKNAADKRHHRRKRLGLDEGQQKAFTRDIRHADELTGDRGTNVCTHDNAYRLRKGHDAGVDKADTDDDCACGGLDHAGDEGAENDTLDGGGGQLL